MTFADTGVLGHLRRGHRRGSRHEAEKPEPIANVGQCHCERGSEIYPHLTSQRAGSRAIEIFVRHNRDISRIAGSQYRISA